VVVAPVLGIAACCLLAGIMNAAAFAAILLSILLSRRMYG
jgi:hypothetical protein